MLSTILVPLDGSPLAEHALPHAKRLAEAASARLVLTRVLPLPVFQSAENDLASTEEMRVYVSLQADRLRAMGLTVEATTPRGNPAEQILEQAGPGHADLIVMSTHGDSGLGRWLYGSVADEVLRRASVPVVVVPPGLAAPWTADRAPRILVPLDGSALAEAALGPAHEFAVRLGSEIVLLQVIPFPPYELYGDPLAYLPAFDPDAQIAEAGRYLGEVAARLRGTVSQVRVRAEVGKPTTVIADVASAEQADLIAMATHGRGGLARLVLGSVATGTLRRANVPLILVRPAALAPATTPVSP
jgi:nucleotide-binding universal stress UspA family protein